MFLGFRFKKKTISWRSVVFAANTADVIQFCWIEGDILRIFAAYRKLPGEPLQMALVMHRLEQLLKYQMSLVPSLAKVTWWCTQESAPTKPSFRGMSVAAGSSTEGTCLIPGWAWSLVLYEDLMISAQTISSCVHPDSGENSAKRRQVYSFSQSFRDVEEESGGFCCGSSCFFPESQ